MLYTDPYYGISVVLAPLREHAFKPFDYFGRLNDHILFCQGRGTGELHNEMNSVEAFGSTLESQVALIEVKRNSRKDVLDPGVGDISDGVIQENPSKGDRDFCRDAM